MSKQPETADQAAEYSDLFFELTRINKDNGIHGMGTQGNPGLVPPRNTGLSQKVKSSFKPAQRQVGHQDGGIKGKPQFGHAGRGQMHQAKTAEHITQMEADAKWHIIIVTDPMAETGATCIIRIARILLAML